MSDSCNPAAPRAVPPELILVPDAVSPAGAVMALAIKSFAVTVCPATRIPRRLLVAYDGMLIFALTRQIGHQA